jgi:hypothetical protein
MFMMVYGMVRSFSSDPAVLLQEEEEEDLEAQSLRPMRRGPDARSAAVGNASTAF